MCTAVRKHIHENQNIKNKMKSIIHYNIGGHRWELVIGEFGFKVRVDQSEWRVYPLPPTISEIEHDAEYVTVRFEDKTFIQLKFEEEKFFVGDEYDSDGMFVDTFANWVFDED